MGCVNCQSNKLITGLLVPEQELVISLMESKHPFSCKFVAELFSEFSKEGISGSLKEERFFDMCSSLSLDWSQFQEPSSDYSSFLDSIKLNSNEIEIHRLLLSCILLGKGTFTSKINRLLKLYVSPCGQVSQVKIANMVEDLVGISTVTLPSLCKKNVSDMYLSYYVEKVKSAESGLISKVLNKFSGKYQFSLNFVLRVFEENTEIQKICWPNGVRLMLIEEDISSASERNTSCEMSSAVGKHKKNSKSLQITRPDIFSEKHSFCIDK